MTTLIFAIVLAQAKPPKPVPAISGAEVIKKMRAAVRAGQTATGSLETKGPSGQMVSMTFKIMYPGLFAAKSSMFGTNSEAYWTKEWFYSYLPDTKAYMKLPRPKNPAAIDLGLAGLESLFNDHNYFSGIGAPQKAQFGAKQALAVALTRMIADTSRWRKYVLYVDPKTYLPLGFDQAEPGGGASDRTTYKSLVLHANLTAKDFEWIPPKDAIAANK